jgi:hypothetical protein
MQHFSVNTKLCDHVAHAPGTKQQMQVDMYIGHFSCGAHYGLASSHLAFKNLEAMLENLWK